MARVKQVSRELPSGHTPATYSLLAEQQRQQYFQERRVKQEPEEHIEDIVENKVTKRDLSERPAAKGAEDYGAPATPSHPISAIKLEVKEEEPEDEAQPCSSTVYATNPYNLRSCGNTSKPIKNGLFIQKAQKKESNNKNCEGQKRYGCKIKAEAKVKKSSEPKKRGKVHPRCKDIKQAPTVPTHGYNLRCRSNINDKSARSSAHPPASQKLRRRSPMIKPKHSYNLRSTAKKNSK